MASIAYDWPEAYDSADPYDGAAVFVSHVEFDTNSPIVYVSHVEFNTGAATADVRVSWCQFDTGGAEPPSPPAELGGAGTKPHPWITTRRRRAGGEDEGERETSSERIPEPVRRYAETRAKRAESAPGTEDHAALISIEIALFSALNAHDRAIAEQLAAWMMARAAVERARRIEEADIVFLVAMMSEF